MAKEEASTAIATMDSLPVPAHNADAMAKVKSGGKQFNRQIRMSAGTSKVVTDRIIGPGLWYIPVGEGDAELVNGDGESMDLLLLAHRPCAISFADPGNVVEVYDVDHEKFQEIEELSDDDDEKVKMANKHGTKFLAYEASAGEIVEFFCNTKVLRNSVQELLGYTRMTLADGKVQQATPVSIATRAPKGKPFFVPVISKCSESIRIPEDKMPEVAAKLQKFIEAPNRLGPEKVAKTKAKKGRG